MTHPLAPTLPQLRSIDTPLRIDSSRRIRVGNTRIPLERIVFEFNQGASPEQIVESFPTLSLADAYAVISYYLSEKQDVDRYMEEMDAVAEPIRTEIKKSFPTGGLRERLLNRSSGAR